MTRCSIVVLISTLTLTNCATTKQVNWQATGGSRADGSVQLSYQYKEGFVKPYADPVQATSLAKSRCAAWGYQDAQAFGGETRTCNLKFLGMCESWTVTREHQCLGSLEK